MKFANYCLGLSLVIALSAGAETSSLTPDDWYQNHYAPLWKDNAWDKLEDFSTFYDETIYVHPPEGEAKAVTSRKWLAKSLREWKSEGWLGGDVAEFQSDQLNLSTVTFKVKWRDWYADDREEFSCGWYLADLKNTGWIFTQYADIDCAEHGL